MEGRQKRELQMKKVILKILVFAGHCVHVPVCGSGDLLQPPHPPTGEADTAPHQQDSC
jgi:hypothetical protein